MSERLLEISLRWLFPGLCCILLFLLVRSCTRGPDIVEKEVIKYRTKTEIRDSIVYLEKPGPIRYIDRIVYRDRNPVKTDSIDGEPHSIYSDTSFVEEKFYLFYTADVTGRLNYIDLGFYDNRPDSVVYQTITNTITETKTEIMYPKGFYLGGQVNQFGEIVPSGLYQWNKNAILTGYNLNTKAIQVGYFRKIF